MVLSPENASSVGSLQSNQTLNTQSIGSQFIEPTSQYVTTIPMVQPILAAPSLENRNPNIMPPVKVSKCSCIIEMILVIMFYN